MVAENNATPDSPMMSEESQAPLSPTFANPNFSVRSEESMMASPSHFSLFSSRKQREFTPDSKKDDTYWDRRRRNNAAAKRSREKRRLNDMLLEKRVVQLSRENHILRAQVTAVFKSYGIRAETLVDMDQVMATLPTEDQLLNLCTPNSMSLPSPPPMAATMIALPRAPSPSSARPIHSPPTHSIEDIYSHGYPRDSPDEGGPPAFKRRLLSSTGTPSSSSSWDEVRTTSASTASNISSPSRDSSSNDDPINLTTSKSRSRSSSETEDEMTSHMPHKLRYKYHLNHFEVNKQTEEDY